VSWIHFKDTKPKAKKRYFCGLCNLPVEIGQQYISRSGRSDGELVRFKMHIPCEAITHGWMDIDWETSIDPAEFREELKRAEARP
jgi:hypothetical protein